MDSHDLFVVPPTAAVAVANAFGFRFLFVVVIVVVGIVAPPMVVATREQVPGLLWKLLLGRFFHVTWCTWSPPALQERKSQRVQSQQYIWPTRSYMTIVVVGFASAVLASAIVVVPMENGKRNVLGTGVSHAGTCICTGASVDFVLVR
jgi:hypothetical protein